MSRALIVHSVCDHLQKTSHGPRIEEPKREEIYGKQKPTCLLKNILSKRKERQIGELTRVWESDIFISYFFKYIY